MLNTTIKRITLLVIYPYCFYIVYSSHVHATTDFFLIYVRFIVANVSYVSEDWGHIAFL